MKKIAFLGVLLGSLSCVSASDGEGTTVGGHGFYYGVGIVACNTGERVTNNRANNLVIDEANSTSTQFGGVLSLGYQFVPANTPYCVGLELGCDFSPRHEDLHAEKRTRYAPNADAYSLRVTRNGFSPFVALRGGYINLDHKFMIYGKVGLSYVSSAEYYEAESVDDEAVWHADPGRCGHFKMTTWMPTLALGLEKSFTKDFTCRGEFEYRFGKKKTKNFRNAANGSVTLEQKGAFNVRVMFCHNIKIGE